jgi:hypothetical protein
VEDEYLLVGYEQRIHPGVISWLIDKYLAGVSRPSGLAQNQCNLGMTSRVADRLLQVSCRIQLVLRLPCICPAISLSFRDDSRNTVLIALRDAVANGTRRSEDYRPPYKSAKRTIREGGFASCGGFRESWSATDTVIENCLV